MKNLMNFQAGECSSDYGKSVCENLGGQCVTETDGYYSVSAMCMISGALITLFYIYPTARKLQGKFFCLSFLADSDADVFLLDLPLSAWRTSYS